MKRDMDLIRSVLIILEDAPFNGAPLKIRHPDYPADQLSYHVMLLHEAGLIHAFDRSGGEFVLWEPVYITWQGHEFLEAAKDDTRWNRAKNHFKEKGVPLMFDVLKSLLVSYAKQALGPANS
jgi:hypothetical protein